MPSQLSDNDLAAMIARDEAAGDGLSTADDLVYTDRHRLLEEVQQLRAAANCGRGTTESPR